MYILKIWRTTLIWIESTPEKDLMGKQHSSGTGAGFTVPGTVCHLPFSSVLWWYTWTFLEGKPSKVQDQLHDRSFRAEQKPCFDVQGISTVHRLFMVQTFSWETHLEKYSTAIRSTDLCMFRDSLRRRKTRYLEYRQVLAAWQNGDG